VSARPSPTTQTWGPIPGRWVDDSDDWVGEWMTLGGETWFSRIHPHGDEGAAPVVMIHGLVVSGSYYRPIARIMDDRHPVYIPDLPGYGYSRSSRIWTIPSLVTQLGFWMDAHGLTGAVVVGNSLGAQMGTLLAVERPDLVRALILIGPTLDPSITNPLQLMWRGLVDIPRERQSLWTIWLPDLLRAGISRALSMLGQVFTDDQLSRLGDVQQTAIVVGGERDPIARGRWVRDMAARLPRGEAAIVPGASHALNYSNARALVERIEQAADLPIL
jgi:2-hydroxy-6-oxonona-2,4-dienedioate hydrolase